jgi:Flp pilus assembly protein TadB
MADTLEILASCRKYSRMTFSLPLCDPGTLKSSHRSLDTGYDMSIRSNRNVYYALVAGGALLAAALVTLAGASPSIAVGVAAVVLTAGLALTTTVWWTGKAPEAVAQVLYDVEQPKTSAKPSGS